MALGGKLDRMKSSISSGNSAKCGSQASTVHERKNATLPWDVDTARTPTQAAGNNSNQRVSLQTQTNLAFQCGKGLFICL